MSIRKLSSLLIGGVFLTVAIYAATLVFIAWPITNPSLDRTGVFGDSFGLLTSLFSGLAFAGLIITILLQKNELALQREELGLTREELSGQKEELKVQNETLRVQRFENTFFNMLSILEACRNDISYKVYRGDRLVGRDAIGSMYSDLSSCGFHRYVNTSGRVEYFFEEECLALDGISKYYLAFYAKHGEDLGQYFRTLYNILKLVERSAPADDKSTYSNLLRSQLSRFELLLLFYNCLSPLGEKLLPLVRKYKILKHMEANLLIAEHQDFWSNWSAASPVGAAS